MSEKRKSAGFTPVIFKIVNRYSKYTYNICGKYEDLGVKTCTCARPVNIKIPLTRALFDIIIIGNAE